MKYKVIGSIDGKKIERIFDTEYKAETARNTLNEIFAPFQVEEVEENEKGLGYEHTIQTSTEIKKQEQEIPF